MKQAEDYAVAVSVVVIAYNMARELPRTLDTLAQSYQRDAAGLFEVVVVDNGSREPLGASAVEPFGPHVRVLPMPNPSRSPAAALNYGAAQARGAIVASMIDGARMLSPGCIAGTVRAFRAYPRPVVIVPSWHLGPGVQIESTKRGYTKAAEDALLASRDWRRDGYQLFDLCEEPDLSSGRVADHGCLAESNFIAVSRQNYARLGGFDERFTSSGGGAVNLDYFRRAREDEGLLPVSLLGEGTFHQVHGGVTSSADEDPWPPIAAEYEAIMGRRFSWPDYEPHFMGFLSGPERRLRERFCARLAERRRQQRGGLAQAAATLRQRLSLAPARR